MVVNMEFFIALFGGLFYVILYCKERSNSKKHRAKYEEWLNFHRQFECILTDAKIEEEIEKIIADASSDSVLQSEIYDIIKDNLISAIGKDGSREFFLLGLSTCFDKYIKISLLSSIPERYWIKHLLLSKKGKMGKYEYQNGYPIGSDCDRERNIRICREIEKNLQSAKTGVKFVLKKDLSGREKMIEIHLISNNIWDRYNSI